MNPQTFSETFICLWTGCKVFGKPSCSRTWLERHVLSHGGNKPYKCIVDNCGQRFSSQVCAMIFDYFLFLFQIFTSWCSKINLESWYLNLWELHVRAMQEILFARVARKVFFFFLVSYHWIDAIKGLGCFFCFFVWLFSK